MREIINVNDCSQRESRICPDYGFDPIMTSWTPTSFSSHTHDQEPARRTQCTGQFLACWGWRETKLKGHELNRQGKERKLKKLERESGRTCLQRKGENKYGQQTKISSLFLPASIKFVRNFTKLQGKNK